MRARSRQRTAGRADLVPAAVISCDEQWTYRKIRWGEGRDDLWIWTAVVEERDGQVWVDFEVGDRSERTFLRLYERLPEALRYCSDGYPVYLWFPQDRHLVGKGGAVNRNEGLHSVFRTQLNRLGRRTKGYTKSLAMLVYSLALVCWYRERKSNTCLF